MLEFIPLSPLGPSRPVRHDVRPAPDRGRLGYRKVRIDANHKPRCPVCTVYPVEYVLPPSTLVPEHLDKVVVPGGTRRGEVDLPTHKRRIQISIFETQLGAFSKVISV